MGVPIELVMTRDVLVVRPEMTLKQLDRALLDRGVSGAPVVEGEGLVGVVSRADVVRAFYQEQREAARISDFYTSPFPIPVPALERLAQDSKRLATHMTELRVRDVMSREPLTVSVDDDLEHVARLMADRHVHRVPVVSTGGRLLGIVTSLDIVRQVAERGLADLG